MLCRSVLNMLPQTYDMCQQKAKYHVPHSVVLGYVRVGEEANTKSCGSLRFVHTGWSVVCATGKIVVIHEETEIHLMWENTGKGFNESGKTI